LERFQRVFFSGIPLFELRQRQSIGCFRAMRRPANAITLFIALIAASEFFMRSLRQFSRLAAWEAIP
jgi:hypothetical protein